MAEPAILADTAGIKCLLHPGGIARGPAAWPRAWPGGKSRTVPSLRSGFRLQAPAPLTPAKRLNLTGVGAGCLGCRFHVDSPEQAQRQGFFRAVAHPVQGPCWRRGALTLELIEVMERDPSPKIELFSLQFRGPAAPRLPQQIHRLEHDKLGAFEIFLTAIGADPEQGILYESVFHRFRKPTP